MSTKGMSVTAARLLLDKLSARGVRKVLVLHDFDVSGFSIFGTLGTDSRRYQFTNHVPLVDIGLRIQDIKGLESEPVTPQGDWEVRSETLRRHGATEEEINFLRTRRVEINALTSRELVDFIEAKLAEHGVIKLIPNDEVIENHARHVIGDIILEKAIAEVSKTLDEEVNATALPADLREQIERELKRRPAISWDDAVAWIIRKIMP